MTVLLNIKPVQNLNNMKRNGMGTFPRVITAFQYTFLSLFTGSNHNLQIKNPDKVISHAYYIYSPQLKFTHSISIQNSNLPWPTCRSSWTTTNYSRKVRQS
jgi:hypothetical protein